ncbi:MAG: 16S rRNA (guanine(966)-N(2))-methyltransferase RsmD [Acholeplasmataceae bacterium]
MRIISGLYKGRKLNRVNKSTTRETADMVREAVFQMIEISPSDIILDLFGGSGAYALEAISRGAKFAYISDHDKDAVKTIYKNASALECQDKVEISLREDFKMLKKLEHIMIDKSFIDPPYLYQSYDKLLTLLSNQTSHNGLVIVETEKKTILKDRYQDLIKIKEKIYGIKKISIYKKEQ